MLAALLIVFFKTKGDRLSALALPALGCLRLQVLITKGADKHRGNMIRQDTVLRV
jgi:hypothetical protein